MGTKTFGEPSVSVDVASEHFVDGLSVLSQWSQWNH